MLVLITVIMITNLYSQFEGPLQLHLNGNSLAFFAHDMGNNKCKVFSTILHK